MVRLTFTAFALSHGVGLSFLDRKDVIASFVVEYVLFVPLPLTTRTLSSVVSTVNVIAETREGNPDHVIISGSHLDSVPAGPGVNDNGSGTSNNLELALATYHCKSIQ